MFLSFSNAFYLAQLPDGLTLILSLYSSPPFFSDSLISLELRCYRSACLLVVMQSSLYPICLLSSPVFLLVLEILFYRVQHILHN